MSRREIEYRPHIWPAILQAAEWYEGEKPGLGGELVDELDSCFQRIAEQPEQFPLALRRPPVHRAMVDRFPCAVYFLVEESRVVVISVVHMKRAAGQWKRHTRRPRSNEVPIHRDFAAASWREHDHDIDPFIGHGYRSAGGGFSAAVPRD